MARTLIFIYGLLAYAFFFLVFCYAAFFVADIVVPKGINDGAPAPLWEALLVNLSLLAAFAIQHTIMARPAFKTWAAKWMPRAMERSTFVLVASAVLALTFWLWRPMTAVVWEINVAWVRAFIWGLYALGWVIVLYSSFLIDHFDLFGLRQVMLHLRARAYTQRPFAERSLYKLVRHPLMLGFIIAFWAAPTMTAGRLLFAAVTTIYIFVGIWFEERDLMRHLGAEYHAYRRRTPMLLPLGRKRLDDADADTAPPPAAPNTPAV